MSWLYRYEAKGIQSWIMATDRLREMGGGSAIIEGIAGRVQGAAMALGASKDDLVLAAGNGLVRLPSEEAASALAAAVSVALAQLAPGLQITSAIVDGNNEAAGIDAIMGRTGARRNAPSPVLPEAGPLAARSAQTGLPAMRREGPTLLDAATSAKRVEFDRAGDRALAARLELGSTEFITDHDQLGDGYVAVIHADGTGVGERIRAHCKSFNAYRDFSAALRQATERATVHAIRVSFEPGDPGAGGRRSMPARVVVLGGDDLTLVCPAELALRFSRAWAAAFEAETAKRSDLLGGAGLFAALGVAMVKPHWPFRDAYDLAESLCNAAKAPARGAPVSALLFHRVTTSLVGDWAEIRRDDLRADRQEDGSLSGGPYAVGTAAPSGWVSLAQLDTLCHAVALQPRGAARQWLTLAKTDAGAAVARWRRWRTVAQQRDPGAWNGFASALAPWGWTANEPGPWGTNNHGDAGHARRITPLGDALALSSIARASEPT